MNIIFETNNPDSPSFKFYSESFSKINSSDLGATVSIKTFAGNSSYAGVDVALFMGGSYNLSAVKQAKSEGALCGIVEPRSMQNNCFSEADIIITNSLEANDFFAGKCKNSLLYYTYPEVPAATTIADKLDDDMLILGYHGNKIHLEAMFPRITRAIQNLHMDKPLELIAMYNFEKLGKSALITSEKLGFPVRHVNYSRENYSEYIAHVDIGLVPQLIPVRDTAFLKYLLGTLTRKFNEKSDDYLHRFKETTNLGRHFVFAQYAIPVVSDMTPSACTFIKNGYDSYLASTTMGWTEALRELSTSYIMRKTVGNRLREKWDKEYSFTHLNKNLLTNLRKLKDKNGECFE